MNRAAPRRLAVALLALALAAAFAAAWRAGPAPGAGGEAGDGKRRGDAAVSVSVARARVADVPVTLDAVGTVQALNTVTARTQVDGRLLQLAVAEGQDVQRGDIIARIDPSLYRAQYDQALAKKAQDEANLANARIDRGRYQKLAAGNFASQQQYATQQALVAQLEALVRADQAAIDTARTTLDYATIRSPIDGRAGIRLVDAGNILRASDQTGIVVITQLKPIYVVFTVPQQALPALQKAQGGGPAPASALGPDNISAIETGHVSAIDNQIDPQTGTVRVKAVFGNADLRLWPGQFVNVRLVLDTLKGVIVVPSQAVRRGPEGAFVYVYREGAAGREGVAAMTPVTTGRQDEALAVVTSGLAANANVVTSGFSRLSNGAKVRLAEPAEGEGEGEGEGRTGDLPPPAKGVKAKGVKREGPNK